jgi:hypothetical protein
LCALRGQFVELAVDLFVAQDGFDVFAGFAEGDGLHKLLDAVVIADALPVDNAIVSCVVGGESVFRLPAEFVEGLFQGSSSSLV